MCAELQVWPPIALPALAAPHTPHPPPEPCRVAAAQDHHAWLIEPLLAYIAGKGATQTATTGRGTETGAESVATASQAADAPRATLGPGVESFFRAFWTRENSVASAASACGGSASAAAADGGSAPLRAFTAACAFVEIEVWRDALARRRAVRS